MGTRSITRVRDEGDKVIIELYKQYDGYPSGLGKELLEFIESKTMVNGFGSDKMVFNGINDFAAQLVEELKQGQVGGVYLFSHTKGSRANILNLHGAEYLYEIDANLKVRCFDSNGKEIILSKEELYEH